MKYSVAFLILGGLVSCLSFTFGGAAHLLHWFSFSCLALAAGYAGLGPRIFGKHPDGRIPLWSRIIHLPCMLYTGALWHIVRLTGREHPTDTVADDLILGRRLRAAEIPNGIANYVDLTSESEDPKQIRESASYVNLPILDADVPAAAALQAVISRLRPGATFVHCAQGHGRTGLFALALLAERGRIRSFEEGMALIRGARPGIGLSKTQERFIRGYIENVVARGKASAAPS
ncbi:MAG: hypothetical protein JXR37_09365 [Kiritimatiellae bacterium]|nr:hypothetical protein [Kiritimatiellia bacterium]